MTKTPTLDRTIAKLTPHAEEPSEVVGRANNAPVLWWASVWLENLHTKWLCVAERNWSVARERLRVMAGQNVDPQRASSYFTGGRYERLSGGVVSIDIKSAYPAELLKE